MTLVARDGTQLFVDATVTPLRDAAGRRPARWSRCATSPPASAPKTRWRGRTTSCSGRRTRSSSRPRSWSSSSRRRRRSPRSWSSPTSSSRRRTSRADRSETRYRALVEASAQLVWVTDADGAVRDVPGLAHADRTDARGGAGRRMARRAPPGRPARGRPRRGAAALAAAADPRSASTACTWPTATYRWYRVARRAGRSTSSGDVREWVGTLTDIDEERRAEEARREEADLVETLHRIGGVLTSELDVERLVQTVTDAATALTGAQFGAFFYNVARPAGRGAHAVHAVRRAARGVRRTSAIRARRRCSRRRSTARASCGATTSRRDPRYGQMAPHHGMPPGHLPVRSYLAVPVISRTGEVLGGLFFGHADAGVFTERAERLVVGGRGVGGGGDGQRAAVRGRAARARATRRTRTRRRRSSSPACRTSCARRSTRSAATRTWSQEGIRGPVTDGAARGPRAHQAQPAAPALAHQRHPELRQARGGARALRRRATCAARACSATLEALVAPQLREKALRYAYQRLRRALTSRASTRSGCSRSCSTCCRTR